MSSEKILLLFGSTGDLGKAAVEFFLNQNYNYYYFFTRTPIEVRSSKTNYEIITIGDLTKEESVMEAMAQVKKRSDANYYLFSTVGGYIGGKTIDETEYSDFLKMLNINLSSSFLIAKYFSRLVNGTQGGSICFTSALSSFEPEIKKAPYNISKNALNVLVKTLALEGKEFGLRANAIAPFAIDTPMNREWIEDRSKLISPIEICRHVQFLFEEKNATGNIIGLPTSLL
jgi:NAD(P)-dependent dehydrogenase (short-subunit alcohol dehydrogenase family)